MKVVRHANELSPPRVGIIGYDGVNSLDLSGPLETLAASRSGSDALAKPCYRVILIGLKEKTFVSQSRVAFQAETTLSKMPDLDTVIIPGGMGMTSGDNRRRISEWIGANVQRIRRVVCVSNGAYPVAQAGLLNGRKIATHWRYAQDLAVRFPRLQVDASSAFLQDGPFYTCGGGTAAIEVTLALIEEDYGSRIALAVARELVVRLRPVGQNVFVLDPNQFEFVPTDRLAELPAWIAAHLNDDLSVEVLAARACLCPRHFSRLFKRFFNTTPATFVERIRLDEARRCLSSSRHSISNVASAVGFASADTFRRAFERGHGMSPVTYRRKARVHNAHPDPAHSLAA